MKTRIIERTRNKWNIKWHKKKVKYVNMLHEEINDVLEKLHVDLTTLITKCKFFEKPYEYDSIEKERELRILAKKRKKKNELNKMIKRRSWN